MRTRGRFLREIPSASLLLLLIFAACTSSPESRPNAADKAKKNLEVSEVASVEDSVPEKSPDGESREAPEVETADPLEEVARLWYGGYRDEARTRFRMDDVYALSHGARRSEWSIWRGRLFLERWRGEDLGLAGENVSALLADHDDVWAGTWTGGITRLSGPLGQHTAWDPGLPSLSVRTVNSIVRFGNTVWMVRYGALERYDLRSGSWTIESGLPVRERLQDIVISEDGVFLATLGKGLWLRRGRDWEQVRAPGLFITNLEASPDGDLIVMTMDRGLYLHAPETGEWKRPPEGFLRRANVTSAVMDEGVVYGGTYGSGGFAWDIEENSVMNIGEDILGDTYVLDVAMAGNRVYFGTFGAGVVSWDPAKDSWDRISLEEGLPTADIAALEPDESGNVWVGTLGGGIVRITEGIHRD